MIGHLILRLGIWFLLTANLSVMNIIIGVTIALLLPRSYTSPDRLKDWLRMLGKILMAIPIAYLEAFEIILRPHNEEEIIREKGHKKRSDNLVFLDIFLITFTPKTIVIEYEEDGWYKVHRIAPRKKR